PVEHSSTGGGGVAGGLTAQQSFNSVERRELSIPLMKLINVRNEEVAAAGRLSGLAAQDHLQIKQPTSRNERQVTENLAILEVDAQSLEHDDIRCEDE